MGRLHRLMGMILLLLVLGAGVACGGGKSSGSSNSAEPTQQVVYSPEHRHPPEARYYPQTTLWETQTTAVCPRTSAVSRTVSGTSETMVDRTERFNAVNELLVNDGPLWATNRDAHVDIKPGDNLIVGGSYLLASSDVVEGGSVPGLSSRMTSAPQAASFITYAVKGLLPSDRIATVQIFGAGQFSDECGGGIYLGVARRQVDGSMGYYWIGPYDNDEEWRVELHGLGAATSYGESYFTVLLYGGDTARIDGLLVRIEEAAP